MTNTTKSSGPVVFAAPQYLLLREPESQGLGHHPSVI